VSSSTRMPCRTCGMELSWTADQLRAHLRMIRAGEHAAPACDDDCAARAAPWTVGQLEDGLIRVRRAYLREWIDTLVECGPVQGCGPRAEAQGQRRLDKLRAAVAEAQEDDAHALARLRAREAAREASRGR